MTQANHPAFVRLSSLGVTTVTGKDALAFLHGQFTNRLQPLGQRAPLAGYCSPKGRLLATMRVWGEGDAISLLLPKSAEPAFLKRIRMYVLRSDVHFAEDAERTLLAGFGEEAEALLKDRLAAAGAELPAVNEAAVAPEITVVRVPDTPALPGVADAGVRYLALVKDVAHSASGDAFAPHGPGARANAGSPGSRCGPVRPEGRSADAVGRRRLRRTGRKRLGGPRFASDGRLRARIVARRGRRDPRQARAASLRNPQRARQLRGAFSALQLGDVLREGVPFFRLIPCGLETFRRPIRSSASSSSLHSKIRNTAFRKPESDFIRLPF